MILGEFAPDEPQRGVAEEAVGIDERMELRGGLHLRQRRVGTDPRIDITAQQGSAPVVHVDIDRDDIGPAQARAADHIDAAVGLEDRDEVRVVDEAVENEVAGGLAPAMSPQWGEGDRRGAPGSARRRTEAAHSRLPMGYRWGLTASLFRSYGGSAHKLKRFNDEAEPRCPIPSNESVSC